MTTSPSLSLGISSSPSLSLRMRLFLCLWTSSILWISVSEVRVKASEPTENGREVFNIGAVLSSGDNIAFFLNQIEEARLWLPGNADLLANTVPMNTNPIRTAQAVCDNLISRQVYTVIVSHPISAETSPASVSFTCGFYNIPVIGISNRDSSLSNKNLHGSFMRTIPPYSHQADVWIEMLKELQYHVVVFIHSSDNDGRSTLGRFQNLADEANVKIETVIEYEPGLTNIVQELTKARNDLSCRVFILYANREDAQIIFSEVDQLKMTSPGYVWMVSEQALKADNRPEGILGLVLENSDNEEAHIKDSIKIVIMALRELFNNGGENITKPPNDCGKAGGKWETGIKLLSKLKNQTMSDGSTGRLAFDENGDRLDSDYEIINAVNGSLAAVGKYVYSVPEKRMLLTLNVSDIMWPGKERNKPLGYFVPTHLKVVTIEEKPFVWVKPTLEDGGCEETQMPCPRVNASKGITEMFCCEGYSMDLLKQLSERLNFTYSLYQVTDGFYGAYEFGEDGGKQWNGLVGDLVYRRADMIVAPLTINPERAKVIDFSKPFKFQGIAMLQKRKPKGAKLESFLQPFRNELWLLVLVSVHVVALVLYLLDRFSPFGRYLSQACRDTNDEKALNFSCAILFAWGVLLNSGIGEKTPRSFSARVLGMVWAGFAMIVVASYTANLAAWLVLDSTETEISGLEDSRLRNPAEGFKYATVKGSYTDMYFRGQVELANMYRLMEEANIDSAEEAVAAVKSGYLNVFFWDSPRLEYEAAYDCNLIISGETFGRSGYGLGLQKHSFWSERVTLELLNMHESGFMEGLDNKWILKGDKECGNKADDFQTTLGLANMSGVFMLVAGGIVGGFGLILIECGYKRRKAKKMRRMAFARKAARKWLTIVRKRKLLRGDRTAPPLSVSQQIPQKQVNLNPSLECHKSGEREERYPKKGFSLHSNPSEYITSSALPYTSPSPYTVEKGINELSAKASTIYGQYPPPPAAPQYLPHFRRGHMVSREPMSAVGPHLNSRLSGRCEPDVLDIPPPPPPPSTSPRSRPTHPLMAYPRQGPKVRGYSKDCNV